MNHSYLKFPVWLFQHLGHIWVWFCYLPCLLGMGWFFFSRFLCLSRNFWLHAQHCVWARRVWGSVHASFSARSLVGCSVSQFGLELSWICVSVCCGHLPHKTPPALPCANGGDGLWGIFSAQLPTLRLQPSLSLHTLASPGVVAAVAVTQHLLAWWWWERCFLLSQSSLSDGLCSFPHPRCKLNSRGDFRWNKGKF